MAEENKTVGMPENIEQEIKGTLAELNKELSLCRKELIECCEDIKNCKTSEERKGLFQRKAEIQGDISEIQSEIDAYNKVMKGEAINVPKNLDENTSTENPIQPNNDFLKQNGETNHQ